MLPKGHKENCICGVCLTIKGKREYKTSELTKNKLRKIAKERGYGKWLIGKKQSIETRENGGKTKNAGNFIFNLK